MFSHIMVGSNNIELSKKFYDCILGTLGYKEGVIDEKGRCFYVNKTGIFAITQPIDGNESTHANGGTIGFSANSQEEVNNWHKIGPNVWDSIPPKNHGQSKYFFHCRE